MGGKRVTGCVIRGIDKNALFLYFSNSAGVVKTQVGNLSKPTADPPDLKRFGFNDFRCKVRGLENCFPLLVAL